MDDPKNPNQNPLDPVVPTTPTTDVPPAPEPLSPEDSTPPIVSDPQQDVPPPSPPVDEQTTDDMPPQGESGLPPIVAPPPAKSKTKLFAAIAAVVLLLVSIPTGIILVRQQQELREQARVPTCECKGGFWTGEDCTVELGQPCSTPTPTPHTCNCTNGVYKCSVPGVPPDGEPCSEPTPTPHTCPCQNGFYKCSVPGIPPDGEPCSEATPTPSPGGGTPTPTPGGGGTGKIPSEQDEGGCCDQGAASNSPKGCRTTGGFNEVCDIANGACQSGFSCRSLAGCAKDTDCGPGNKCVNSKCESGGGGSPAPSQAPTSTPSPTPAANTCSATIAGLPGDFISPNQSIPVTVKLDSSTAGCEYVALRTDGTHEPSLKTVSGACVGATYGATINSGLAGQHKLEFAVNDTQPYPGAPSRSKTVCSTKTFETIDLITAPAAYCTNLQVLRAGAPITDFSQVVIGDNLTLQATCITTSASTSFDKIRFRVTTPAGAQTDQDQTATKDVVARIHQVAEQPNIYKATATLRVDRIGNYNIKVWGHTKEDNKWKGKK